ncbi:hypothetical protein BJY16_004126 [Actinoplanes octamycinicus]|uniref:Uncharacterized protein n=1 Tax=Actinoplanes octamycinicus TaxID=135948 RepID=A0A7W7GYP3_9ACTN|nr:hypothetical protein [Actinoplanes octamycinicus]
MWLAMPQANRMAKHGSGRSSTFRLCPQAIRFVLRICGRLSSGRLPLREGGLTAEVGWR